MPIALGIVAFVATWILVGAFFGPTVCRDGSASPSIGRQGACSHHGGVNRSGQGLPPLIGLVVGIATFLGVKRLRSQGNLIDAIREGYRLSNERSQIKRSPCPTCGAIMHPTLQRQGPNAGRWFLICSRFPECRGFAEIPNQ
jgi:hypothetical protein